MEPNPVFEELRKIMLPYAQKLDCTIDQADHLDITTHHRLDNGKLLWFGGIQIQKHYVSYYLMPVYVNPSLLENISTDLKKRMQGKSCFNFKTSNPALLAELALLTKACYDDYRSKGYV